MTTRAKRASPFRRTGSTATMTKIDTGVARPSQGPKASRPSFAPSYGVPAKGKAPKAATWARVEEALRHSRNYWIATTRPDGRPHAAPVWGVWLSGVLYFGSDRASRKGKNIAHQPYVVAHLESGDDVVILEGTAREVKDKRSLSRMDAAYAEKYGGVKPSEMGGALVYAVRPEVAFTWEEADFVGSAVRWKF